MTVVRFTPERTPLDIHVHQMTGLVLIAGKDGQQEVGALFSGQDQFDCPHEVALGRQMLDNLAVAGQKNPATEQAHTILQAIAQQKTVPKSGNVHSGFTVQPLQRGQHLIATTTPPQKTALHALWDSARALFARLTSTRPQDSASAPQHTPTFN